MKYDDQKLGGMLLFIGSCQWLFTTMILESLQPNYVGSIHYVSSLGVGTTGLFFNLSLIILGGFLIAGCMSIHQKFNFKPFTLFLVMTGACIMGVGLFPEGQRPWHGIFTGFSFIFAGIAAIISFKVSRPPLSYLSIMLGAMTLFSAFFFFPYLGLPKESTLSFLGLYKGTLERIVIYPAMFWIIGFSIYVIYYSEN